MPKEYLDCVASPGSKKFTKKLAGGKYIHGCKRAGSNKAVWGEVKTKQPVNSQMK
jgi:hypothetical protein